jgi:hypothetical protein
MMRRRSVLKWFNRRSTKSIPYVDPLHAGRHPFQTYMLALSVVSGLPILFGYIGAGSVARELPFWLAFCWGLALFLGSSVALVGSYWRGNAANALTIERAGLALVGSAAIVYGIVIAFAAGQTSVPGRIIPISIIEAYGFSCLRRARDIGYIIQIAISDLKREQPK